MRAFDDVLMKMGLSKKKRRIQNAASLLFLPMQRGKGLPKREDIKQGILHTAFDKDIGDRSKLEQNRDAAERSLPSAKVKPFLSLRHT